ncbi:MAG: hypothetical protein K2X81_14955 [Candidatus Obscuribacterales bacterium]|nr:hypothetical protein [Candidatus Obscuribacterales bacterium]
MKTFAKVMTAAIVITIGFAGWLNPIGNSALANPTTSVQATQPLKDLTTDADLSRWLSFYYLHPQPDLTLKALNLVQKGNLAKTNVRNSLVAFFSQVMAQNPQRLAAWTEKFKAMDDNMKGMLWTALWQANTSESNKQLAVLTKSLKPEQQKLTLKMPAATAIEKMTIDGPSVLDMLWAAYCATGDERYVKRVISVLTPPDTHGAKKVSGSVASDMMRAGAAQWSLTSNARLHKKVMAICIQERQATTNPALKKELAAVIEKAQAVNKTPRKLSATK